MKITEVLFYSPIRVGGKHTPHITHAGKKLSEYEAWEVEFYPEIQTYIVRRKDTGSVVLFHPSNVKYASAEEDYKPVSESKAKPVAKPSV